jgi:hypothetical protein
MHLTNTTSQKRMEAPYNGEQESSIYKGQPCTLQVPPPIKAACSYTRSVAPWSALHMRKLWWHKITKFLILPLHANHLVPTQVSSSSSKKSYQARKLVQDTRILIRVIYYGLFPPTKVRAYLHRCSVCDHAH